MSGTRDRDTDWEQRRFGLGTASAIVVANMIGAGLFTTSGFALADLGSAQRVLWAWALGGVIALCGALSYGGIAHRIPICQKRRQRRSSLTRHCQHVGETGVNGHDG